MIKHLTPFVIAVGVVGAVDLSITFTPLNDFLANRVQNFLQDKMNEIESDNPREMDVLFLGTSRTMNGFATEVFEASAPAPLNAYNFGLASGDYYLFKLVLEHHIRHYGKPRLVLLGLADCLFNPDNRSFSDYNTLYLRTMIANDPALAQSVLQTPYLSISNKVDILFASISGIYRYRSVLAPNKVVSTLLGAAPSGTPFAQGWRPREVEHFMLQQHSLKEAAMSRVRNLTDGFTQADTRRLEHFLNFCMNEEIPVVLVQWPTHPTYAQLSKERLSNAALDNRVAQVLQRYDLLYVDLNGLEDAGVNISFADPDHLSEDSAREVTRYFAKSLFKFHKIAALFEIKNQSTTVAKKLGG